MAGCGGCGGYRAHCGASCGSFGGESIGLMGMGGFGGFGFHPFFGGRNDSQGDDTLTPVDADALVDPNQPGHRDAIKAISHVDDEKHEKTSLGLCSRFWITEPE